MNAVAAPNPGYVIDVISHDPVVLVVAGTVADVLNAGVSMKFKESGRHARNIRDSTQTELCVKIHVGSVREPVRVGLGIAKLCLVDKIRAKDVSPARQKHLAVSEHVCAG